MGYQRVKFEVFNNDLGTKLEVINDPKNAEENDRTIKRSLKNFGVVTELSKGLVFTTEVKEFLDTAYAYRDIEADVTLKEFRVNPDTEEFYVHSIGVFDFSDWDFKKTETKVPFKTGGLNALLKSQLKEKFEIDRLESINGTVIDAITEKIVALTSRDILLISQMQTEPEDATSSAFRMAFTTPQTFGRSGSLGVPMRITIDSDEHLGDVIRDSSFKVWENQIPDIGSATAMAYLDNDIDKKLYLKLDFHCICRVIALNDLSTPVGSDKFLRVELVKYNDGLNLKMVERKTLYEVPFNAINGHEINFVHEEVDYELLAGESFSVEWHGSARFGSALTQGELKIDFDDTITTLDIREESVRPDSQTKAILFHDIGEKLMQILTGKKGLFYSEFYGSKDLGYAVDGEFSLTAGALGLWIRLFNDKKLELSFDDLLTTMNVIHNTGYTIDVVDGEEKLVVEDVSFFFQDTVVIKIPTQVNNIRRRVAKEFSHSSLQFGYKKGGEYEEAMGLDEYNVRTGLVEPITRVDTKYIKVAPSRADAYAKEFARRKSVFTNPEEDTRYDLDMHLLDLKKGLGTTLEERVWQDDYEEAPKNIFSPDTATGLRLTPYRINERHQKTYGAGLTKFQDKKVRFSNNPGNSDLITKKTGETERAENGDINISELQKALFLNQWIEFEFEVDFAMNNLINGRTSVNGRLIPNFFFKIEFINELNQKEYGYLFQLKPNKQGKWKLLKAVK